MLRRSIRRIEPPRPPQLATKYEANSFEEYEEEIRPLLATYFNTLQTIYPTGALITLINSSVRPKRVVDEVQAKRLMHQVFREATRLHEQVLGMGIPPINEERYTLAATRAVSVPADRDMTNMPGIIRIQTELRNRREERENRRRETEEVEERLRLEEERRPESFRELEGVVTPPTARKINEWLSMQYEGHMLRAESIESKQLLREIFQPFGLAEVQIALEVAMSGRLYKNITYQDQVQLSNRLNYNFELIIYQEDEELQEEVAEANALLIFTSLFYALIPELLGMLLLFRETETRIIKDYFSPLTGMNLDPNLYYIYDSSDPEKFNTMVKSGTKMTIKRYLQQNKEIALSGQTYEQKYRRLFSGVVRLFRLTYTQMNKEMIKRSKEWASWEEYTVDDDEGNKGLPVRNVNLNMVVPYIRGSGLDMNFPEYKDILDDLLETFTLFQIPLEGNQKLQWEFYGKKNDQINDYQFFEMQGDCIEKLKADLQENNYPKAPYHVDIDSLKEYCRNNNVTLKFIGAESYFYASKHTIVATPSHVELVRSSGENYNQGLLAAYFRPEDSFNKSTKIIARERRPSKEWRVGQDLPYDEEISPGLEKELRCHVMVVDIESLALEEERQIPYMINVVGYPGDNSHIVYRSWTNKGMYRYESGVEEEMRYSDSSWENEYCIFAFVEWLGIISKDYAKEDPLYIWGFNSMGYELTYLLLHLTRKFGEIMLLGHPSQCKAIKICGGRIVLADILKILPIKSLFEYGKEFNLKVKKLDYNIELVKNWEQVDEKEKEIKHYCYIDCVSTLLLVFKTQATLIQLCRNLKIPHDVMSIAKKLTASSLGWFIYVQGFLKKSISNNTDSEGKNVVVNNEPFWVYLLQRFSYTGGIVQVYKYVAECLLYVVDVNSMYPAMMLKVLPWYYEGFFTENLYETLKEPQSDVYLYEVVSYELPASFVGSLVALKIEGSEKNIYMNSYYGSKTIYVRGMIVKRLIYHKASVVLKSVHKYGDRGNTTLREFAKVIYAERLKATNKSMNELTKLMLNSVTGRCAMNEQREFKSRNSPTEDNFIFYDEDLFIQNGQLELPPSGRMVRLTAAITDYAKVYLDELHEKAGYGNVMYCDTDSLIVNKKGYKNLGSPGRTSTTLGEFKVEVKDTMAYDYYEAGYFKNRKDYILKFTNKQGKTQYLHKAKGIPKKYRTDKYTEEIIRGFKLCQEDLVKAENGTSFTIGPKIDIKVWRRHPFEGTTIRNMAKKTTVIVDRYFETLNSVGLPRQDKYIYTGELEDY